MGASFAEALRPSRPGIEIVGIDSNPATLATALERGIIREPGIEGADVIVLAVPPLAIRDLLPNLPRHALVTDMASTKARIMTWAAESGVDFVGGHPMCGRELSGIDAADPDLFRGAPWVLTRIDSRVEALVRAVGPSAFILSAAYALAVAGSREWPEMAGIASTGFRDMTRLAAGSAEMYAGIAATNAENIVEWLLLIEKQVAKLRRHIEAGDPRLAELFEEAREKRERWIDGRR